MMVEIDLEKEKEKKEIILLQQIRLENTLRNDLFLQKKKIANDLHDGVSGTLAALSFYLADKKNNCATETERILISEIEGEINTVNENLRKYLYGLRISDNLTIIDAFIFLKQIAKTFSKNEILKIELNYDENIIVEKLSSFELDQLSYILTESVSNAIKHSNAKNLKVNINATDVDCQFSVIDNGHGFISKNVTQGLGLINLKNRLLQLGGELNITSYPTGTKVSGNFNLKK